MKQPSVNEQVEPQRPLLVHAPARIAFGEDACKISDFAALLVPTTSDALARPGEFITQARQLRKMTAYLMTRAVLLERARGSSWAEIAAACGQEEGWVRSNWEPAEQRWNAALSGQDLPEPEDLDEFLLLPPGSIPAAEGEIRKAAELLDTWVIRHRAAEQNPVADGAAARRPVTSGIEQT